MSEQDRKGAPVGAGLGEQDAYARGGGGVIIEPVIVEAVGEASGSGSRIVQVDLDTGHYQRTANWEECAPSTLDGGVLDLPVAPFSSIRIPISPAYWLFMCAASWRT